MLQKEFINTDLKYIYVCVCIICTAMNSNQGNNLYDVI
jgi:hypothetical protein